MCKLLLSKERKSKSTRKAGYMIKVIKSTMTVQD